MSGLAHFKKTIFQLKKSSKIFHRQIILKDPTKLLLHYFHYGRSKSVKDLNVWHSEW